MNQIILPGTSIKVSRFIFGTASLFNAGNRQARQNLLSAAVEHGFTHFDTAPYYGFGAAEKDLSMVLNKNKQLTVTTKAGLYPPGQYQESDNTIFLRKMAGKIYTPFSRPVVDWSIARAQQSLEASMKRLGREHIDIFMLHEPRRGLLNSEEWLGWLQKKKQAGQIGDFGIALTADKLREFLECDDKFVDLIQVQDSIDLKEADIVCPYNRAAQITYGYVSSALSRTPDVSPDDVLSKALSRNSTGAIIVSTKKIGRLDQYRILANRNS